MVVTTITWLCRRGRGTISFTSLQHSSACIDISRLTMNTKQRLQFSNQLILLFNYSILQYIVTVIIIHRSWFDIFTCEHLIAFTLQLTSFHSTIEVIQSTSSANEVDDEDEEEEVEIPSKSSVRIQLPASSIQLSDTKPSAQSIRRQSLGAEPSALSVRRSKVVPDVKAEPSTHTVRINKAAPWSKASLSQKSEKRQSITAELKDSSSILLLKILKNLEDKTESKAEKVWNSF